MAATDADSNRGTQAVKVTVVNEDEMGVVTLSQVQPRVGVAVTASLTDPDDSISGVKWQWYNGTIDQSDLTDNAIAKARSATYTPKEADAEGNGGDGVTLYARASYTDGHDSDKFAVGTAVNMVAEDTRNKAPVFEDQDDETDGTQNTEATREVAENTKAAVPNDNAIADDVDSDNVGQPGDGQRPRPQRRPVGLHAERRRCGSVQCQAGRLSHC